MQTIRTYLSRKSLFFIILLSGLVITIILVQIQTRLVQKASEGNTLEVEKGTLGANTFIKSDSTASGGEYIEFGIKPQIVRSRPLFGSYAEKGKLDVMPQAKDLIANYAQIVYPEGMNWCGAQSWNDPQVILDYPVAYSPAIPHTDSIFYDQRFAAKGITGRGYVYNATEGDHPKPSDLPANVSDPRFEQAMIRVEKDCTRTVVSHYKDLITNWRIANEMFQGNGQRRLNWFGRPIDIRHKIQAAKEANPNAEIFIDDYSAEEVNDKSTGLLNYMKQLKQEGNAIDGIGFQGHFSLKYPPNYTSVRENVRRFAQAGFKVAYTEFDVAIDGVSGTEDEKRQRQADVYRQIATICKEESNCTMFMLFGMDDNRSWLGTEAKAHPFDTNFQPKPAFESLRSVFNL